MTSILDYLGKNNKSRLSVKNFYVGKMLENTIKSFIK